VPVHNPMILIRPHRAQLLIRTRLAKKLVPITRHHQPSACLTSTATKSLLFVEQGRSLYCTSKHGCRAEMVVAPGRVMPDRPQNRHQAKFPIFVGSAFMLADGRNGCAFQAVVTLRRYGGSGSRPPFVRLRSRSVEGPNAAIRDTLGSKMLGQVGCH
jgi:hypothetical protein